MAKNQEYRIKSPKMFELLFEHKTLNSIDFVVCRQKCNPKTGLFCPLNAKIVFTNSIIEGFLICLTAEKRY